MIKSYTLSNDSSQASGKKELRDLSSSLPTVKMLVSYSKALQVVHCHNFETCYIVLN
jgi:hypothetical protein